MKRAFAFVLLSAFFAIGCQTTEPSADTSKEALSAAPAPVTKAVVAQPVEMNRVVLKTSLGDITIELDAEKAPLTVANFKQYVADGFYANTIFHRVIPGFMVQGGGFDTTFLQKPTRAEIKNEAANGLKNVRGTIAMARTPNPHSASSQFFINLVDNPALDYRAPNMQGYGYCVFGKVVNGMEVVDAIAKVTTGMRNGHRDVPVANIVIYSATLAK